MLIDDVIGFIGGILLVLAAFAVNFMAEIGGSDFYIKHGFSNYFGVFVVLCVFKAVFLAMAEERRL